MTRTLLLAPFAAAALLGCGSSATLDLTLGFPSGRAAAATDGVDLNIYDGHIGCPGVIKGYTSGQPPAANPSKTFTKDVCALVREGLSVDVSDGAYTLVAVANQLGRPTFVGCAEVTLPKDAEGPFVLAVAPLPVLGTPPNVTAADGPADLTTRCR